MPVMGSSLDLRVEMLHDGEMRRSAAREGAAVELELAGGTLMRTFMSGAVRRDMIASAMVVLGYWK